MKHKIRWRVYPVYARGAGSSVNPLPCISLKDYCAKYFLSKRQVLYRLNKRQVCAVSFKKKIFIVDEQPTTV